MLPVNSGGFFKHLQKRNMESKKTHWKKHFNPNYLGSYSLDPGEEKILTIVELKDEEVVGPDGKKEVLPVLYLKGEKPMILNKTNAKAIAKVCDSDYVEDWFGKDIQIYAAKVSAFGKTVEAVRVRPITPKKKTLNKSQFERMVKAIGSGEYDKIDALERFELTADQRKTIQGL